MFRRVIVYILVGLFVVFVVLPKLLALLADAIHRHMDKQGKHREQADGSPRVEELLRTFAQEHPENAGGIEQVLVYRRRVGEEF